MTTKLRVNGHDFQEVTGAESCWRRSGRPDAALKPKAVAHPSGSAEVLRAGLSTGSRHCSRELRCVVLARAAHRSSPQLRRLGIELAQGGCRIPATERAFEPSACRTRS